MPPISLNLHFAKKMNYQYNAGFKNHFSTEALPGALPLGNN
jgi:homogentisate 1,2-dioxygenase